MNQRTVFTLISAILILQGIGFFLMKDQIAASAYPGLDAPGLQAVAYMMEVLSALSILIGFITYGARSTAGIAMYYTVGALVLVLVTSKHMFVDNINVPVAAFVIQVLILLVCAYMWMQERKGHASAAVTG
jgi:hypothetical protein